MCREPYRRVTISLFFLLAISSVFKCWVQLERIDILEMMHLKQWNWDKLTCPIDKCWWPCFKKNSIAIEVYFFFWNWAVKLSLTIYTFSERKVLAGNESWLLYACLFKIDLIHDQILRLKIFFLLKSFLLLCQRKCWKKNVKTAVVYKLDGMGGYFVNLGNGCCVLSISWELCDETGKRCLPLKIYPTLMSWRPVKSLEGEKILYNLPPQTEF